MGNAGAMGELISDICFYLFKFQLFIYIYHCHVLQGKSKSMNTVIVCDSQHLVDVSLAVLACGF